MKKYILLILALVFCVLAGWLQGADAMTRARRPRGIIARPTSIYAVVPVALASQLQSAPNAPLLAPPRQNRAGTLAMIEWRPGTLTAPQRAAILAAGQELNRRQLKALEAAAAAQWR